MQRAAASTAVNLNHNHTYIRSVTSIVDFVVSMWIMIYLHNTNTLNYIHIDIYIYIYIYRYWYGMHTWTHTMLDRIGVILSIAGQSEISIGPTWRSTHLPDRLFIVVFLLHLLIRIIVLQIAAASSWAMTVIAVIPGKTAKKSIKANHLPLFYKRCSYKITVVEKTG